MFSWFKKRRLKEQQKLFFQNSIASSASLRGYFRGDHAMSQRLSALERQNSQIISSAREFGTHGFSFRLVSNAEVEQLLEINRELREIYDSTVLNLVGSFDKDYTPPLGWEEYYKTCGI